MLLFFKRKISEISEVMTIWWHKRQLLNSVNASDGEYRLYLDAQLKRTLLKRNLQLHQRCRDFIDKIASVVDLKKLHVLCVGCRNSAELDYFQSKGVENIVGIDLYSSDKRILVMDMHSINYKDGFFDLVYSSHSLEHSNDPLKVASEIIRVTKPGGIIAVEVPVDYQVGGADLYDFHSLDNLHSIFSVDVDSVIWSKKFEAADGYGTAVIRTIFMK